MTLKNLSVKDCMVLESLLSNAQTLLINYIQSIDLCDRSDEIELEIEEKNLNDIEELLIKVRKELYGNKK